MMKLEKARGFHNMEVASVPHPVSSIIYSDEDILFAKDVSSFVSRVRDLEAAGHTLALFRDTGAAAGEMHTGVVVMFPGKGTDECLQAWGKQLTQVDIELESTKRNQQASLGSKDAPEQQLDSKSQEQQLDKDQVETIREGHLLAEEMEAMGPDQRALGKTSQCKKNLDHASIHILPGKFLWLPTPQGMSNMHVAEFVHFTNTARWRSIGSGSIKRYLQRLGLPKDLDPTGSVKDKECAARV